MRNTGAYVYVLHSKHGDVYSLMAKGLLKYQIEQTYEYEGDEVLYEACRVYAFGTDQDAWTFLSGRSHWEYENVSREELVY